MTMRVRWRGFELPTRISVEEETRTDTYAKFITEPFQRGFGTTVGNGLRRVLLSSLEGAAVTHVKFDGIDHEYTTIPGVYEDVTDIILNVKELLVRLLPGTHSATLRLDTDKIGEITAGDLIHDHTVEIVNPGMHIARITEATRLKAEIHVQRGRGYRTAEENQPGIEQEIGVIPIASFFSPVKRVRYRTENTRVGQLTNYDKLVLEIWTDGTVTPENGLVEAAKILRKHLNPFIHFFDLGKELKPEFGEEEMTTTGAGATETAGAAPAMASTATREQLYQQFMLPVTELDLSVRAQNCLESENIRTIGELCRMKEEDLVKLRNFGRVTLKEIEKKLQERGLRLGMTEEVDSILANR